MSLEQLPPTTKAFIGYTPYIEPKFNLIASYKNGMSVGKIAIELDISPQAAQKEIDKLIEQNILAKREAPKHLKAHIKAQAVYMMKLGATQQQAVEWLKKVANHAPDKSLITKWKHQKAVKNALLKIEQKQSTKH